MVLLAEAVQSQDHYGLTNDTRVSIEGNFGKGHFGHTADDFNSIVKLTMKLTTNISTLASAGY